MGASGLILLMAGLEVERSLAFCPEIDLFGRASFSKRHYAGPGSNISDLWGELADNCNLRLFYGEECEHDLLQLTRLRQRSEKKVSTFAYEPHGVIEAIHLTEGFDGVLKALLDGDDIRPRVITRGHISGSTKSCLNLWDASNAKASDPDFLGALDRSIAETARDRTYYPQLLYWRALLSNKTSEKIWHITEAFSATEQSLRIARLYFKSTDADSSEFKRQFLLRYGERYTSNARAAALRDF